MNRRPHSSPTLRRRTPGFSLIEALVVLAVLSAILGAVVALFNLSGRIARVQTQVSDMQQSLRIAQYDMVRNARMAGRGGLPRGQLPNGIALSVRNEIPATGNDARVAPTNSTSPEAMAGTDILIVRGVFSSPLYQVNPAAGALTLDGNGNGGSLTIQNPGPSGVPQDLQPLIDAVNDGIPEALLLISPLGSSIYGIVELNPSSVTTDVSNPNNVTLRFESNNGTHTAGYQALSPGGAFPSALRAVSAVGILEEYRYYVRKEYQVPGDNSTEPAPRLSRARVYPGSDNPHAGAPGNLSLDIADAVLDLQLALGVDIDDNQRIDEADPRSDTDDWVFNSAADDETNSSQVSSWNLLPSGDATQLYYLRVTTVARTGRREVSYLSPPLGVIEDRDHAESVTPSSDAERVARMYRRLRLQTIVDLRNVQ